MIFVFTVHCEYNSFPFHIKSFVFYCQMCWEINMVEILKCVFLFTAFYQHLLKAAVF